MLRKRLLSAPLCLCMVAGMLPVLTPTAQAAGTKTMNQLREDFKNRKYWNHKVSVLGTDGTTLWNNRDNSFADSCTDFPCTYHDRNTTNMTGIYDCNYYYGLQCFGFARRLAFLYYGSNVSGWTSTQDSSLDSLKAGDVVDYGWYYDSRGNIVWGHTIWITSVSPEYMTYTDCNGTGVNCQIRWDKYDKKSIISDVRNVGHHYTIWHAPYAAVDTPTHYATTQDLGADFYAYISNPQSGCNLENRSNNVQLASANRSDPRQLWHFTRQDETSYKIINMYDGRCLDTDGASATSGVWVLPYNGNELQKWRFYGTSSDGPFYVAPYRHNSDHAYVLDIQDGNFASGTNVQLYKNWYLERGTFDDSQVSAQTFRVIKASEDEVKSLLAHNAGSNFYSRISFNGAYLQTTGNAFFEGNHVAIDVATAAICADDPNQIWHFVRQSDGSYKITNEYANLVLNVYGAAANDNANVSVAADSGTTAQRWYLLYSPGDSTYRIVSALRYPSEPYSLDIDSHDGSNAQIYHQNESVNQQFSISGISYTRPSPPAAPANVQVNATSSGITVTWDAVPLSGIDNRQYEVWLESGDYENNPVTFYQIVQGTSYATNITLPIGEYTIGVRSMNTKYRGYRSDDSTVIFCIAPEPVTHTITVEATEGGTASGSGTYSDGASVTVSAAASKGYEFKGWTENGSIVSTEASYTFNATADRTLTATFEKKQTPAPITYTVNVSADSATGGTATGSGTYQENTSVTVTATANEGYTFKNWMENGSEVSTSAAYTFIATTDRTLVAVFEKEPDEPDPPTPVTTYTVSVNASPAAGGTVSGGGSFQRGESATVRATPNDGYRFVCWRENGEAVSFNSSYTFSVSGNTNLTAVFEENTPTPPTSYTISVQASPAEGGTVTGGNTYQRGATVTIAATPNSGYQFKEWQLDGRQISTTASYTFTASADQAFTAVFEKVPDEPDPPAPVITYTVSVNASPVVGGTVAGGGTYQTGTSVEVIATPNSGYRFVRWAENGSEVSSESHYAFNASADRTLIAVFEQVEQPPVKTYSVSLSANPPAGGSVSGGGTFAENSTVTVTATASSNYRFTGWFENGSQVSASASYMFTVSADRTLAAGFTYTGGSTITPGGNPGSNPSSGTTGNISPSQPSLPVSTSGANSSMTTTASPNATIRNSTATSVITSAIAQEIIKQATTNNSGEVVIAPVVRTGVTKAEITLPSAVLSEIEQKTNAGLIIST